MRILSLIALVFVISSCGSNKFVSDIQSIRFGSGGGFTGEIKKYELSPKGVLSTINNQDTTALKKISPASIKEIMTSAETIKDIELNKPENMYRFIEVDHGKSSNRLVWGMGYQELPPQVDTLFNKLTNLLN